MRTRNTTRSPSPLAIPKELRIDGSAALAGEKLQNPNPKDVKTYRYRGVVYEVTAETKQEWLEESTSNKRKRGNDEGDGVGVRKKVRKDEGVVRGEKRGREGRTADDVVSKKDARVEAGVRTIVPSSTRTEKKRKRETDSNESTRKRLRTTAVSTTSYFGAPEKKKKRRPRPTATQNRLSNDYTVVGNDHIKLAQQPGSSTPPILPPPRKSTTPSRYGAELQRFREVEKEVAALVAQIKALDEVRGRGREELGEADEKYQRAMQLGYETATAAGVAVPEYIQTWKDEQDRQNSQTSPGDDEPNDSVEKDDGTERPKKVDSASPAANWELPETNKAGHTLRWSLPKTVQDGDGAEREAWIVRKKMEGESHAARRGRVRRERKVLEGWEETSPS